MVCVCTNSSIPATSLKGSLVVYQMSPPVPLRESSLNDAESEFTACKYKAAQRGMLNRDMLLALTFCSIINLRNCSSVFIGYGGTDC